MTVTRFPRAPMVPADAGDVSFVIDTTTWTVTEAGRLAAIVLGIRKASNNSCIFDAGMPAVVTLRAFVESGARTSPTPVKLILWVRRVRLAALCGLARVAETSPLVRVAIHNVHDLIAELGSDSRGGQAPLAETQRVTRPTRLRLDSANGTGDEVVRAPQARVTSTPERDDRETLLMIARRIEDGVAHVERGDRSPVDDALGSHTQRDEIPSRADGDLCEIAGTSWLAADTAVAATEANDNRAITAEPDTVNAPPQATETAALARVDYDHAALVQLLAQTAHEIKTPLSAISAASEIIRDERLGPAGNERYRTYAADIHASATHALAVVDRLMKMPSGWVPPANAPATAIEKVASSSLIVEGGDSIDLNQLISATAVELRPLMEARQLELTVRLDPSDPRVRADALGLKQALLNILTNAMKFTPPGGSLHLETAKVPSQGVSIRLRDTGPGMTKGAIARLLHAGLDPTVVAPSSRPGGGLGLGLRQVRSFCAENNADLSIDSTLGRGTLVRLLFSA